MIIQPRYFEHLCLYVVLLLMLPCEKQFWGVTSIVGDATMMRPGCMEHEREALLEFKRGLVDDSSILSSWGRETEKKDCCNWRGIKCNNLTGNIITLDLQNDELSEPLRGKISPSLHELQHLRHLDLSNNDFGGSHIPKFIGSLSRLQYLNLQNNDFFGTIPHQLGNLTNLRALYLGGYKAKLGVKNLDWLSNLRFLGQLYLYSIDLRKTNWMHSIDKLSFLSELHLVSCKLPEIIPPALHLTNFSSIPLAIIDLSSNSFTSFSSYSWLFNFSSTVVEIDMSYNPLGGDIPDAFGNMMSLKHLNLGYGSLEGEIPKSFRNLSCLQSLKLIQNNITGQLVDIFQALNASKNSLETLDLRRNNVCGYLVDFTTFSSLKELWLGGNKLQGSFPKSFGQISFLDSLGMSNNELNGSFPNLTSFPSLTYLYLKKNKLKGRLPDFIGKLSNLKELVLSFNLLTLEFTSDWTPLFQLDYIELANCKLGPHFPNWLQSQNNFSVLDISNAGISDAVPYWFWDLSPNLQYLNISENHIHGMLPDLSFMFDKFPTIDLHSNHFQGLVSLFPRNVSSLNLSKNMFSGPITSLCTIEPEFLRSLDLSNNLLSGELPDCWIRMKTLEFLDLGNNNFFGKIPTYFGFLHQLQFLSLHNNNFIGELPSSLKNCTTLEVLDISENKLSGQVPAWIGTHLTSLVVLTLRRNEFNGSIPLSMCNLNSTQVLDFSLNKISGIIPQCINKLNSLIQTKSSSANMSFGLQGRTYIGGITIIYNKGEYMASALVQWKGKLSKYRNTLGLLKCIDLSSNKLVGKIPQELTSLEGLVSLNLSRNNLSGDIMQNVSEMKMLEVLDLSKNQLSGEIPTGLASLTFLSVLDLSNNNFSGKIPSSTQLQSFNASTYAGNHELCGLPLIKNCSEDESAPDPPSSHRGKGYTDEKDANMFIAPGFYVSVVLGFTFGFWGFTGPLLLRSSWRYSYFMFLNKMKDWTSVTIAINMARLQRKLRG
ncbi:hypothetical protein LguiB_027829 [Lonicera macranthoides]